MQRFTEALAVAVIRWGVGPVFGFDIAARLASDPEIVFLTGAAIAAGVDVTLQVVRAARSHN